MLDNFLLGFFKLYIRTEVVHCLEQTIGYASVRARGTTEVKFQGMINKMFFSGFYVLRNLSKVICDSGTSDW